MTGEELLTLAAAVVRDRRRTYGEPGELFERVAVRWSQHLGTEVTACQVGLCLSYGRIWWMRAEAAYPR